MQRLLLLGLILPLASLHAQTSPPLGRAAAGDAAPQRSSSKSCRRSSIASAGRLAAAPSSSLRSNGGGQQQAAIRSRSRPPPVEEDPDWAVTLERIANSVVSIEVDATRAFDTEWNSSAQATGFVVDAERGLILTNRHVVTPGPVTSEATFLNREEVQLYPVYRDPVHDFGFYRYDPTKLRFIKPKALPLYPEGAQIGREIRVIGNNAGEQLSILAGTLARLDREAPEYGIAKYNDFNTFYLQAASGTSGGSSGSPVVDIRGRVVALNAGGASGSASSFYLPLGRVKRALELIQQGKAPSRAARCRPCSRTRRMTSCGASASPAPPKSAVRKAFPQHTGMLVVSEVLPGSPSDDVLQPGDILVKVNGKLRHAVRAARRRASTTPSAAPSSWSSSAVASRSPRNCRSAICTPSRRAPIVEFGEAIVHTLSYQQARHFNVPVRGAYVANPGYVFGAAGIPRGAVISSFNRSDIATVDDLEAAIGELGDGDRATVRFITIDDPNGSQLRSVRMDRRWFPAHRCVRDDKMGTVAVHGAAGAARRRSRKRAAPPNSRRSRIRGSPTSRRRWCMVSFDMPYSVSGITERNYHGTGLVVDAERGLVVVDRNTVPVSVGDVSVTFAGTLQVPARVSYIHPLHNLADRRSTTRSSSAPRR